MSIDVAVTIAHAGGSVAEAASGLRVGDDQRYRTESRLRQAFALGYLSDEEFDDRLHRAPKATSGADLAAVSGDLTVEDLRRLDPARRIAKVAEARRGLPVHAAVVLAVTAVTVLVWLIGGIATAAWYPWPLWPVLGGVVGLLFHTGPVIATNRTAHV